MSVRSAQAITVEFVTSSPTTQAAVNADSLPTGTLVVNGTDNAATVTVTNVDTGRYKAAVTLPTLAIGDIVELSIAATVSTIAGKAIVWRDTKDVLLDASGQTTFGNTTIGTVTNLTNLPAITTNWLTAAGLATDAAVEIAGKVLDEVNTGATHNVTNSLGKQLRLINPNSEAIYPLSGTVNLASATSTTATLDASASAVSQAYQYDVLNILSGTGAGQSRPITNYTTGRVATVSPAFTTTPDATSTFDITPSALAKVIGGVDIVSVNGTTFVGDNIPAILADGVEHGGTPGSSTATYAGKKWNLTNPDGDDAFHAECTGGGIGIAAIGFGSSPGVSFTGGATGDGFRVIGLGGGSGVSVLTGGSGNGITINPESGPGIAIQAGGFSISGSLSIVNSTGSSALILTAGSGNAAGVLIQGHGNQAGILVDGGATGDGISCTGHGGAAGLKALGGSSGGPGILANSTSGPAMALVASTTGNGLLIDPGGHGIVIEAYNNNKSCLSLLADSGHAVTITATGTDHKALLLAGDAATDALAIAAGAGGPIDVFNADGSVNAVISGGGGGSGPTASQIATAVWQDATAGDFTVSSSIGKLIMGQPTADEVAAIINALLSDVHGAGSWLAGSSDVDVANIAAAVWDEVNTAAAHNINNSAGKQLRSVSGNSSAIYSSTIPNQAGMTSTTVKLDPGASAADGAYEGNSAWVTSGTGAGGGIITHYVGSTRIATVNVPWDIQPIEGDAVEISPSGYAIVAGYLTGKDPATLVWAGATRTLTALPVMPTDWVSAVGVSAGAVAKIQLGLSTYGGGDSPGVNTLLGRLTLSRANLLDNLNRLDATISSRSTYSGGDTEGTTTLLARLTAPRANLLDNLANLDAAISTRATNAGAADALLGRNIAGGSAGGRTVAQALAFLRNKWTIAAGTLTVYEANDSSVSWTAAVAATAGNPITGVDPA